MGDQKSLHKANSDEIIENSYSDSEFVTSNGTPINQDENLPYDIDFINDDKVNDVSQNTAKECTDTQLLRIVKQLQDLRTEQHWKYINHQNDEAKARETKSRFIITHVNLMNPENFSAESPKR